MRRKVKLFIASSLDCHIARSDGSVEWLFTASDYGYARFYDSVDTVIIGRKTYETALKFEEHPYRDKKCYVFTRNPAPGEKHRNAEFVSDVVGFTKETSCALKARTRKISGSPEAPRQTPSCLTQAWYTK
jgi:dihydrofolate reductase